MLKIVGQVVDFSNNQKEKFFRSDWKEKKLLYF